MSNPFILFALLGLVSCVQVTSPTELKFSSSAIRTPSSLEYQSELQMSDRQYVESVLLKAFDVAGSSEAFPLQQMVYEKVEFGGGCDKYEVSDINGNYEFPREICYAGMKSNSVASSIPSRYSYTMKACEFLTDNENRQSAFMAKVFSNGTLLAPTSATIQKAYGQFYVEEQAPAEVVRALLTLSQTDVKESWRQITLLICTSPGWQVL